MESEWESRLLEIRTKLVESKRKFTESMEHVCANFDELDLLCNSLEKDLRSSSSRNQDIKEWDLGFRKRIFEGKIELEDSFLNERKKGDMKNKVGLTVILDDLPRPGVSLERGHLKDGGYGKNQLFKEELTRTLTNFLRYNSSSVIIDELDIIETAEKLMERMIQDMERKGLQIPQDREGVVQFLFSNINDIKTAADDEAERFKKTNGGKREEI